MTARTTAHPAATMSLSPLPLSVLLLSIVDPPSFQDILRAAERLLNQYTITRRVIGVKDDAAYWDIEKNWL
jgi:hypothetical protein